LSRLIKVTSEVVGLTFRSDRDGFAVSFASIGSYCTVSSSKVVLGLGFLPIVEDVDLDVGGLELFTDVGLGILEEVRVGFGGILFFFLSISQGSFFTSGPVLASIVNSKMYNNLFIKRCLLSIDTRKENK
jgi:hypothetical protein